MQPHFEKPWSDALNGRRYWYHTMNFPDGETIAGSWTIDGFDQYIGGYDLKGKALLDVGTASGYLAFNAEQAGAEVTGLDAASTREFRHFPHRETLSYRNVNQSREMWERDNLVPIKRSWWYSWHKYKSKARCVYAPIADLYEWDEQFDVVMAGAIVEHLSDPVYAIGAWTKVAREAVLIPFTDVVPTDDAMMQPITPVSDPNTFYVWWHLSRGLYVQLFDVLGFDVRFAEAEAVLNDDARGPQLVRRPSIVATRR